ncbi:MAG: hypothetical protein Kow0068_19100 [Marinilabiliales bacterium]
MKIIILLLSLLFVNLVFGQEADNTKNFNKKNSLFIEIGGNSVLGSLNYERNLLDFSNFDINIRGGIGPFIPINKGLITNLSFNSLFLSGKFKPEVGAGITFVYDSEGLQLSCEDIKDTAFYLGYTPGKKYDYLFNMNIGFRYFFKNHFIKCVYVPYFWHDCYRNQFNHWAGISYGIKF